MSRKKKYIPESWASNSKDDCFGKIYDGMCKHKAFKSLSVGERFFYILCRVQSCSADGRSCLYNHGKDYGITYTERDFVFPAKHLEKYGVDRSNAGKWFKKLEEAGFIVKKENNKHMKKVNVYSFSDKWKDSS